MHKKDYYSIDPHFENTGYLIVLALGPYRSRMGRAEIRWAVGPAHFGPAENLGRPAICT